MTTRRARRSCFAVSADQVVNCMSTRGRASSDASQCNKIVATHDVDEELDCGLDSGADT